MSLVAQLIAATASRPTEEVKVCECCGKTKSIKSFSRGTAKSCSACYRRKLVKPRAAATKVGPDQVCETCGETKPRQMFATGSSGKSAKTCFQCYRTGRKKVE